MNDRLVTALGALAALVVLALLLFQGGRAPHVSRPVSVETGPNGYAALAQWLAGEGVPVRSMRTRLDALGDGGLDVPKTGNVLITSMPHSDRLRRDEAVELWRWIGAGNTLLIMAALDDTPDWSMNVATSAFLDDLGRLTGLPFSLPEDVDERVSLGDPMHASTVSLEPVAAHPLMTGVDSLRGESDSMASVWEAKRRAGDERAALQLARESVSGEPAMWEVRYGAGHIIVSGLGTPLTNRMIGEGGNREFVANLLAYHLVPGGAVVFDDMHQGLSTLYDPDAFFSDPRLGVTVMFVLGFWALYVLGSGNRLAPLRAHRDGPRQSDFVGGVGGFLARKLSRAEAGRLMVDSWFEELRQRGALPAGASAAWQALAGMPAVEAAALARLRVCHDALSRGEDVDLREVHNTIEELRRMLT